MNDLGLKPNMQKADACWRFAFKYHLTLISSQQSAVSRCASLCVPVSQYAYEKVSYMVKTIIPDQDIR